MSTFQVSVTVYMIAAVKLDRDAVGAIVRAVADRLDGDWLLVGGAFAALRYRPERVTEDVDIFSLDEREGARLSLLELAAELGLPVEAVNSAADFFVRRIEGWRSETELLCAGKRGRVVGPMPTLFLLTKVRRLSEEDLADCVAALRTDGRRVDRRRVLAALAALPAAAGRELGARRAALRSKLRPAGPRRAKRRGSKR